MPRAFSASVRAIGSIVLQYSVRRSSTDSRLLSFIRCPRSISTDTSKKSAICTIKGSSGTDKPDSHLYTAPTVTPSTSASCSWVIFLSLRSFRMFCERVSSMVDLLSYGLHYIGPQEKNEDTTNTNRIIIFLLQVLFCSLRHTVYIECVAIFVQCSVVRERRDICISRQRPGASRLDRHIDSSDGCRDRCT